jgi:hypothetical protein
MHGTSLSEIRNNLLKIPSIEKQCRVGSLDLRKIFFLQGGQLYKWYSALPKGRKGPQR